MLSSLVDSDLLHKSAVLVLKTMVTLDEGQTTQSSSQEKMGERERERAIQTTTNTQDKIPCPLSCLVFLEVVWCYLLVCVV